MLVALANGCCVISETCKGHGPLVPGKHFIMVEPEYLIPACEYYLARPNECESIAKAGRQFVETQLRQADACRAFLQEIEAAGAMPLQPDAAAVPFSGDLKRHFARHNMQLLARALKDDLRGEPREKSAEPIDSVNEDARAEVIRKRAGYRARLEQQEQAKARGEAVAKFHDNAAYDRSDTPKLSVIVTLYNYAQHIDECLTSATYALARVSDPTEVVIVNDASTDESLGSALRAQGRAAVPMRIVDKKFNTGLADARNVGVEVARAPFVFMLDADNLVYPNAFAQLLAAISSDNHAAAYSLLARFHKTPDRRIGLLSYYDWDPHVLVQHPYIDAMAMFRREALLSLGGYDNHLSQIGWFGWEDYEMWLRFAERDLPVAFVPNTLCLYRHHEQSMINSTNLFERDLVAFLMKRFSGLVDRYEPRETLFGIARRELADREANITASRSSL
jgi:glycosyltransferase involved in cell wall biosynthesis